MLEYALELLMKKDLDDILGSLDYMISKRKKIKTVTIPTSNYIVFIG